MNFVLSEMCATMTLWSHICTSTCLGWRLHVIQMYAEMSIEIDKQLPEMIPIGANAPCTMHVVRAMRCFVRLFFFIKLWPVPRSNGFCHWNPVGHNWMPSSDHIFPCSFAFHCLGKSEFLNAQGFCSVLYSFIVFRSCSMRDYRESCAFSMKAVRERLNWTGVLLHRRNNK